MKNKNKTIWGARFKKSTSKIFEQIGASIDTDKRLFEEDILGSIIHTQMLVKQKIIKNKKGKKIINGLKKIRNEIRKNRFSFNKKYEDIHLNIEKRLFAIIGSDAGYLHIATEVPTAEPCPPMPPLLSALFLVGLKLCPLGRESRRLPSILKLLLRETEGLVAC